MKTQSVVLTCALACTVALMAQQRNAPSPAVGSAGSNTAIVSKLSEIVAIRERLVESYRVLVRAGQAPENGIPEFELAEARIELARERGQADAVIAELKSLVAAHERHLKKIGDLVQDRIAVAEIDKAKVGLLEAQIRLLRAQK